MIRVATIQGMHLMRNRPWLFAVLLGFFCSAARPASLEMDHYTILVEDLERSARFYQEILQLEELETPWGVNPSIRFFGIGQHRQLHIAQVESGAITLTRVVHTAFAASDFDGYLDFLNSRGITYSNFDGEPGTVQTRPDGVRQIYFQDPDGYWIEINDARY
jgi:catechol 2,3-dioxygenase-like lactoylglutathione lyase family enzyme